jgi:uncharacterized protein
MKIDLNEVATHLGKHISYVIDELPIDDPDSGVKCIEPIRGKATFGNTGRLLIVRGVFETIVELECARCLGQYPMKIESPIEEAFQLPGYVPDEDEAQEEEEAVEDDSEVLFVENMLHLTELLRQDILLAMPIKPICSEECKGLCPACGRNLNEGLCGCPPDAGESAFAELASLLEEPTEEDKDK